MIGTQHPSPEAKRAAEVLARILARQGISPYPPPFRGMAGLTANGAAERMRQDQEIGQLRTLVCHGLGGPDTALVAEALTLAGYPQFGVLRDAILLACQAPVSNLVWLGIGVVVLVLVLVMSRGNGGGAS